MSNAVLWSPRLRVAVIVLHAALLLWMIATARGVFGYAVVAVSALALPGLVAGRLRTYGWASMWVAFVCAFAVSDWWMPGAPTSVLVTAVLAAMDFAAMALYARTVRRERPPQPGADASDAPPSS